MAQIKTLTINGNAYDIACGSGTAGEPGYTPQKGTDYWTEEDKQEIKSYVEEAILGGAW